MRVSNADHKNILKEVFKIISNVSVIGLDYVSRQLQALNDRECHEEFITEGNEFLRRATAKHVQVNIYSFTSIRTSI